MKYLFLVLLAACGKHDMPRALDLADTDGDQIFNEYETSDFSKYVADITPLNTVQAELKIKQGKSEVVNSTIEFENTLDFANYTKDLMVKHLMALPVDDYFSHYSILRIKKGSAVTLTQDQIPAKLKLEGTDEAVHLTLITREKREFLGTFTKTIEVEFSKTTLEKIVSGEFSLAVSRNVRTFFDTPSQETTVKEKTYRVFVNDGTSAKIYYVSKLVSFEEFLKMLGISSPLPIEGANLLTTNHPFGSPVWWVRNLNEMDKVLVREDLRILSDHFLAGLSYQRSDLIRENGRVTGNLNLLKKASARALIKIRVASQSKNQFDEWQGKERYRTRGGREDADFEYCYFMVRRLNSSVEIPVGVSTLRENLLVMLNHQVSDDFELVPGNDESGYFWEVRFVNGITSFDLIISDLPAHTFTGVGLYEKGCPADKGPQVNTVPVNFEHKLHLVYESYVEKLID